MDIAAKSSYLYATDENGWKLTSGQVQTTREGILERLKRFVGRGTPHPQALQRRTGDRR